MTHDYCCSWCEKEFRTTPDSKDAETATCPVCGMAAYPRNDGEQTTGETHRSFSRNRETDTVE